MNFRFDKFVLDTQRYELRSGAEVIHVEPQVFDVLAYLLTHRDRVVSKDELLDQVWGSRFVTESTLTSRIKAARQAIGDDGQSQAMIQTVRGRGFRFVADAHTVAPDTTTADTDHRRSLRLNSMPMVPGDLVGRDEELAQLVALLRKTRLVTVVGPGGVGKTRCALEAAGQAAATQGLDADFIDLVPTKDAPEVIRALSDGIGLRIDAGEALLEALCVALREKRCLLILDNFEHVLDAAPVVAAMLRAAPEVRVLITSRERLRLPGEQVLPLDPLSCIASDAGQAPAVELFEAAAQRLDPGFNVDPDNLADVTALCEAVDGLPLGVELIAAHVRLMPPKHLRVQLGNRLHSLSADARGVHARQRTLRDTVEWSMNLLNPHERDFLARLSVFRSGADLDAIERICRPGQNLEAVAAVAALTDKSLLRRRLGSDGAPRFSMLELVREQARDMLVESSNEMSLTRDRHAAYHHDLVRDVEDRRWHELSDSWMATLNEHYSDIHAALEYDFAGGDPARAARTVARLSCYWHRAWRLNAGEHWTALAFEQTGDLTPLDVGLLHEGAGYLQFRRSRMSQARYEFQAAVDRFDMVSHHRYHVLALVDLAGTWMGDAAHAAEAIAMCERAVAESRDIGDLPLIAHAVNVLGELTRLNGDLAKAWAANREGLALTRRMGDELHQAILEMNLSTLALHRGDIGQAQDLAQGALRRSASLGSQVTLAHALYTAAGPHLAEGDLDQAARLFAAAQGLFEALGVVPGPGDQPEYQRIGDSIAAALTPQRLAELTTEGRRLSPSEAVAAALR